MVDDLQVFLQEKPQRAVIDEGLGHVELRVVQCSELGVRKEKDVEKEGSSVQREKDA